MAGRLGNKKVTIQNLKILNIDNENNLIILKGAVPGHKGSLIKIVDAVKKNQKISINDEANKDSLPENSQNNNTNVSENVTTITQETTSHEYQSLLWTKKSNSLFLKYRKHSILLKVIYQL